MMTAPRGPRGLGHPPTPSRSQQGSSSSRPPASMRSGPEPSNARPPSGGVPLRPLRKRLELHFRCCWLKAEFAVVVVVVDALALGPHPPQPSAEGSPVHGRTPCQIVDMQKRISNVDPAYTFALRTSFSAATLCMRKDLSFSSRSSTDSLLAMLEIKSTSSPGFPLACVHASRR